MWNYAHSSSVVEPIETHAYMKIRLLVILMYCKQLSLVQKRLLYVDKWPGRNPLHAAVNNRRREVPYNSDRAIDTFRLFIDLVDISDLQNDFWTSSYHVLSAISRHPYRSQTAIGGDIFLWTLETLGTDFWQALDEREVHYLLSVLNCDGKEEWALRLLEHCDHGIDARQYANGYSSFHKVACRGRYPSVPLALGANVNLVGFDPCLSPWYETPLSLSMYRANTFVALQRAIKSNGARLDIVVDQALQIYPLRNSPWTEETLVELLSTDWEFLPIDKDKLNVCQYCLYRCELLVDPYWMRILDRIARSTRSQNIRDVVITMLDRDLEKFDDDGNEVAHRQLQMQMQANADSRAGDQHLIALDDEPMSVRSEGGPMGYSDLCDSISLLDKDMCAFCWQSWIETGLKPLVDQSKCLCCGLKFSSQAHWGREDRDSDWCCRCVMYMPPKEIERRVSLAKMQAKEDDEYSPYLIHT